MTQTLGGYGKVLALGHRDIAALLTPGDTVEVEEKIDGSQVSWSWDAEGNLTVRSKGRVQYGGPEAVPVESTDKLFRPLVEYLLTIDPAERLFVAGVNSAKGLVFRGEAVTSPRHNVLAYERVPRGFVILFDVELATTGERCDRRTVLAWAEALGIEAVQVFGSFEASTVAANLDAILQRPSMLGGGKMEGVVLKNSERTNPRSGKAFLVGKVVRPEFKEVHKREWKKDNPGARDVVEAIIDSLNTEARFQKAVQALNEAGELVNAPQDIGNLMRQVKADTLEEERDWIASRLIAHFMPTIERGIGRGLPEWYKDRLIEALPTVPVTDFSLEADCGSENIETEENDCAS